MLVQYNNKGTKGLDQMASNIPAMYHNYSYNWSNFALMYNRVFLEAALKSSKSFVSEEKPMGNKKI